MSTSNTKYNDPTPAMIERCKAWSTVVETLEKYLAAAAQRYDWISESTGRSSREMPQPEDLGEQFAPLGSGGIKDSFSRSWWDSQSPDGKCADDASAVIKNELMSEVESSKEDLEKSISDFTELSASFESPENAASRAAQLKDPKLESRIKKYVSAVSEAESGKQPEIDPFLIKTALDTKIDSFIRKHNVQADAYAYVEDAAKKVDSAVVERSQALIKQYTDIAEGNGKIIANGAHQVGTVFVHQPKLAEYKYWSQSSKAPSTFVGNTGSVAKARESDSHLGYPKENSPYAKAIRAGALERRTRFSKNYAVSDYVLTPLSSIEMRHNEPVWSIDSLDAELLEDHKANADDQFVIRARQHGSNSGAKHNWVFRARVASNWKRDLKASSSGSIPDHLGNFYTKRTPSASSPAQTPTSEKMAGSHVSEQERNPFRDNASTATSTLPQATSTQPQATAAKSAGAQTSVVPPATSSQVPEPSAATNEDRSSATATTSPLAAAVPAAVAPPNVPDTARAPSAVTPGPEEPTSIADSVSPEPSRRSSPSGQATIKSGAAAVNVSAPGTPPEPTNEPTSADAARKAGGSPTPVAATPTTGTVPTTGATPTAPIAGATAVPTSTTTKAPPAHPVASRADADSDVSDVSDVDDTGYRSLHAEEEGTLAWKAERDMDVFSKPPGSTVESTSAPSKYAETSIPGSAAFPTKESSADVWEYDERNKNSANTSPQDVNFQPADASSPVEKERRSSQTNHKYETPAALSTTRADPTEDGVSPEEALERRRSSVNSNLNRKGSRKATGSFGELEASKPSSGLTSEQKKDALEGDSNPLYFSSGLPKPAAGK